MMIKVAVLVAIVAVARDVSAEVTPELCETNTTSSMQSAVNGTLSNCESGLLGITGLNSLVAATVNVDLGSLLGPLLGNLLTELEPFLSSVLVDVVQLLNSVLTAVVDIVNAVIKLLNGLLSSDECSTQAQNTTSTTTGLVQSLLGGSSSNSSSSDGTSSLLTAVVNVLDGLVLVVANVNL